MYFSIESITIRRLLNLTDHIGGRLKNYVDRGKCLDHNRVGAGPRIIGKI